MLKLSKFYMIQLCLSLIRLHVMDECLVPCIDFHMVYAIKGLPIFGGFAFGL